MGRIRQRLKAGDGASIVIALIVFLVLALISVTIVSAAAANAQRVGSQRKDERAYLSVTSAAALLREQLAGDSVIVTVDGDEESYDYAPAEESDAPLSNTIRGLVRAIREDTTGTAEPYGKLRMQFSGNSDLDVDVWLIMKNGGTRMEAVITPPQSATAPETVDRENSITLIFSNLSFRPVPGAEEAYELTFSEDDIYARGGPGS